MKKDTLRRDENGFVNLRQEGKEHAKIGDRRKKQRAKKVSKRKTNIAKGLTGIGNARKGGR